MLTNIGAFLFVLLAFARVNVILSRGFTTILDLLLIAQSGLAAILLIFRRKPFYTAPRRVEVMIWLSAGIPLLMNTPATQTSFWLSLASTPGLMLNLWGLAYLGSAFGIAPAERGLVLTGPYRLIRHPMYSGELLSLVGVIVCNPSTRNSAVLAIFLITLVWRIYWEEKILLETGYKIYAKNVKWRLLPGIW
jgi:protein-S-isoprenylcysteine O-methyltransferase Ste14